MTPPSSSPSTPTSSPSTDPVLNLALDRLEDRFGTAPESDAIFEEFSTWASNSGRPLYPHQEEALLAAIEDENIIVATPTGSGKSIVAMAAIFTALARGRTAFYTAPLKALVSEKFFDLIDIFGAENVGMITGDISLNSGAPIICATAEIVANMALKEGASADIGTLIHDEFHFYSDPQRGWAWQVPLLELTHTQHVLLSATLGDTTALAADMTRRTRRAVTTVSGGERPVPLHFSYSMESLPELIKELVTTHRAPVYVVNFVQKEALAQAQALLPIALVSKKEREAIAEAIGDFRFGHGFGHTLSKLLRAGIGIHHAGLLPRYRRLVERLTQAGHLRVICGTDTLGVGINVPIRTVVMTSLTKFDGSRQRHLTAREFHQIAGRAGRAGYDTVGDVIVQAPEHEIENARAIAKAGDDPKKLRKIVKRKPPEGSVLWSEKTFEYLRGAEPETLTSQMQITHAMMLNLLQRPNSLEAILHLLTDNHEPSTPANPLLRRAVEIYTSLHTSGVLRHEGLTWQETHPGFSPLTLAEEVPTDFALNSPLAPFALACLELLDKNSPTYAIDVVSLVEAVQESPMALLYAQQRVAKNEAVGRMKAEGLSYEQRMAELDSITWPRPLAELLEAAFATYRETNPWVLDNELTPKSIVRDMIESAMTFSDFISRYDLARSEGLLLRYLTDTYRGLRQIVPPQARTTELDEILTWLASLVRSVDSSLLDEWEMLLEGRPMRPHEENDSGGGAEFAFGANENEQPSFTSNLYALRKAVRNALFACVEALELEDEQRLNSLATVPAWDGGTRWDAQAWFDATDPYYEEYDSIGIDTHARSAEFFFLNEHPTPSDLIEAGVPEHVAIRMCEANPEGSAHRLWLARQIFDDEAGDHLWGVWALVDLEASDELGALALSIVSVGEI